MHPFATYVLRSYYRATGWNEDNSYLNLTRASSAVLDFNVPQGLRFAISKSPNALFRTSYSMNALPSLNGSVGYIFTSCDLDIKNSGNVRFKDMVDRFQVYDQPRRPDLKAEEWLAGERVDARDYLLYGRIYIPTGKLDALYSTRLSPTWQASVAAISEPPAKGSEPAHTLFNLQHDVGRTCAEYSWSVQDGMFGARVLHNFGKLGAPVDGDHGAAQASATQSTKPKRVDEEDAMEGGLKGRISAGAEAYFSFQEKSGGVSTGIRFTTLPDATPPSFQLPSTPTILSRGAASLLPSQPPTTITATLNPIIGHIQGAYAARVSRDLTLCSRFDFNVYSYESEWTMGAEWWIRRSLSRLGTSVAHDIPPALAPPAPLLDAAHDIHGVVKARASTSNDVSLMWEGRIRNLLVSLGVVSNLSSLGKPIKAIGLELSYFSSE